MIGSRAVRGFVYVCMTAVGCDAGPAPITEFAERDSAGVRIVENAAPRASGAAAWVFDSVPVLDIGLAPDGVSPVLHNVSAAVRLADGRIVIANDTSPVLRWFDPDGRFLFGTGRVGDAAGEFSGHLLRIHPMWVLPGDSVATWQHSIRQMQVFGPDGEFARSLRIAPLQGMTWPTMVGRFETTGFATWSEPDVPTLEPDRQQYGMRRFARFAPDGSYAGQILDARGLLLYGSTYLDRPVNGRVPFSPVPAAATSGDRFYFGAADAWEFRAFDPHGALRAIVRRADPPRLLTDSMRSAHAREQMASAPADPSLRTEWRRVVDGYPYPDRYPAYRAMRVDPSGNLWIESFAVPGDTTVTWSIFDAQGIWRSEITLPRDVDVLDIGENSILVLARIGDVHHVRLHRLRRH